MGLKGINPPEERQRGAENASGVTAPSGDRSRMAKPLAGGHALEDSASLQHERTVDDHIGDALGHLCRFGGWALVHGSGFWLPDQGEASPT